MKYAQDQDRPLPLTRAEIARALPTLRAITAATATRVRGRLDRMEGPAPTAELDAIDADVQGWFRAVRQQGAVPRGLWLVEFPGRAGWFGWQDGDEGISLFRPYGTPPEERAPLH